MNKQKNKHAFGVHMILTITHAILFNNQRKGTTWDMAHFVAQNVA